MVKSFEDAFTDLQSEFVSLCMEKLKKWFNRIGGFEYGCKEREKNNRIRRKSILLVCAC